MEMQCSSFKEEKFLIIVAAGSGKRMQNSLPKQFIEINNKPVLFYTIEKFSFIENLNIILVLNKEWIEYWKKIVKKKKFKITHHIVEGGKERFYSVKNALKSIKTASSDSVIIIHDGVRPFVSRETIENCIKTCQKTGNSLPYITPKESIRLIKWKNKTQSINREKVCLIQTPQCFRYDIINEAYKQRYGKSFTDDSSVVSKYGVDIHLVEGNRENIKITDLFDLTLAQQIIDNGQN